MRRPLILAGLLSLAIAAGAATARAQDTGADEPNDSALTATVVGHIGFTVTGRALPVDDVDWYRFEVPTSGAVVSVELSLDAGLYDTSVGLEIYASDGTTLLASGVPGEMNGVQTAVTAPLAAGYYLVKVTHQSGTSLDDYMLRSTRDNDSDESNDTAGTASDAGALGFVRTGRVLPVADADWYSFDVAEAGAVVTAEMTFDADAYAAAPILDIRSASGSTVLAGGVKADEGRWTAQTAPLAVGTYLVRVAHGQGVDLLDYSLRTFRSNDSDESNDTHGTSTDVGSVGFARRDRVLTFGDTDWYRFTVPAGAGPVTLDFSYDMEAHDSLVDVELRADGGTVLATATPVTTAGPFRTSPLILAEGVYHARITHTGGDSIPSYTVQAYTPLGASAPAQVATSVGAQINVPFDIRGGIRPYTLTVDPRFAVPPGLVFDGATGRMTGSAATAGRYSFLVACNDSGSPASTVNVLMELTVNPRLDVTIGEFTAFATGKDSTRLIPATGGTAPFTVTTNSGSLPDGVSLTAGPLGFSGAANAPAENPLPYHVQFDVTDAAGLTDSVDTTCVLCSPFGTLDLPGGAAATGVTFDAVKGSTVAVKVTTAKREAKRALRAVLLGSDGITEIDADVRAGNGTVAMPKFVAPATGRYFLVIASDSGAATHLVASGRVTPPAKLTARVPFTGGATPLAVQVGAIGGATLTFSAKPDRNGPSLSIQGLLDPSGTPVAIDPSIVRTKAGSISFTTSLPTSGTWTVLVNAATGSHTNVTWTATLKQPKKGMYSAD